MLRKHLAVRKDTCVRAECMTVAANSNSFRVTGSKRPSGDPPQLQLCEPLLPLYSKFALISWRISLFRGNN